MNRIFASLFASVSLIALVPVAAQTPAEKGFAYLDQAQDRGIRRWFLFDGVDSGLAHLYPSLWLNGNTMTVEPNCRDILCDERSSLRVEWKVGPGLNGDAWNGIIWHNSENWNGIQGPPYDLSRATKITGKIRSGTPGLGVSLFFGGNPVSVPKSFARLPGDPSPRAWIHPSTDAWESFEIDLSGRKQDLKSVQSGFGFTVDYQHTPGGQKAVFYLGEIAYEFSRPDSTPRLLPSYGVHPEKSDLFEIDSKIYQQAEPTTRNVAYVYDQALVILAYLARGDAEGVRRARIVGDALVYCAANHRSFDYAHNPGCLALTNGLMAGDARQFSGRIPKPGMEFPARVSGWYDALEPVLDKRWKEDLRQVSSNTGDIAWAIIALTGLYNRTRDPAYLKTAVGLGNWVRQFCRMKKDPQPGFTGGQEGWPHQKPARYKSVEMNIDLISAFYLLHKATGDASWIKEMQSARAFVLSLFDDREGRFLAGVSIDPEHPEKAAEPNRKQKPLDVNAWALLVLGPTPQTLRGFRWAEAACKTEDGHGGLTGFAFGDSDLSGVWPEGTGQMIVCYRMLGKDPKEDQKADGYLRSLRRMQAASPGGKGIVAASKDGLWTGFDVAFQGKGDQPEFTRWNYFSQIHLGGLCWFLFSEIKNGYNPFFQQPAALPPPKLP